jgi:predicted kinase
MAAGDAYTTPAKLVIIVGPPSCGKTTLCKALATSRPRGYWLSVDFLRESMLGGFAFPAPPLPGEWVEQSAMARQCAQYIARTYLEAGVDVFIDDTNIPANFHDHYGTLLADATAFFLYPGYDEMMRRLRARNGAHDGPLLEALEQPGTRELMEQLRPTGFITLDDPNATVEQLMHTVLGAANACS